jgi:hypothetical protein
MPNRLLDAGAGIVRNTTAELKAAGFVETDGENDPTRLAPTRVRAYEGLLLVVDRERVAEAAEAELDAVAASGTDSAYQAVNGSVQTSGNAGYKLQLPVASDAGFAVDDTPRATARASAPGIVCIYRDRRLETVEALLAVRAEQVDG